ncbi:hypothetical protein KKH27_01575 [bacterium]|nr:hypothetical protein [bacterium]MBU1983694.1 hypothetical protein [bacterium]
MIGFLIGVLISAVAAVPALLLQRGGRESEMKIRLKLWAIGLAIRFAVIGAALYLLFTETQVARIPTVIGVALAYFIIFLLENAALRRA